MTGLFKKVCYMSKSCKNHLHLKISNFQVDSKFKLVYFWENQGIYTPFLPKKNSNNINMTQWSIRLLKQK